MDINQGNFPAAQLASNTCGFNYHIHFKRKFFTAQNPPSFLQVQTRLSAPMMLYISAFKWFL